jgi:hypothetical protein
LENSYDYSQNQASESFMYLPKSKLNTGTYWAGNVATAGIAGNGQPATLAQAGTIYDVDPYIVNPAYCTFPALTVALPDATTAYPQYAQINPSFNKGFLERWLLTNGLTNGGAIPGVEKLKDMFKFCEDRRKVVKGNIIKIRLYPNNQNAMLCHAVRNAGNTANLVDGQVTYVQGALWYPVVKPDIITDAKLTTALSSNSQSTITFNPIDCQMFPLTPNTAINVNVSTPSEDPEIIIIGFRTASNDNNQLKQNSFWEHFNCNNIYIQYDKQYPSVQFTPDFPNKRAIREYEAFLQVCDGCANQRSVGNVLSYEDWLFNYPLFCFDLRHKDSSVVGTTKTHKSQLGQHSQQFSPLTSTCMFLSPVIVNLPKV